MNGASIISSIGTLPLEGRECVDCGGAHRAHRQPRRARRVVYGVEIPGTDGRAGTAALLVNDGFDLEAFRAEVTTRLPPYARPVFLRILTTLEATGTFKPRKQISCRRGFDPGRIADPLF